jgi:signal transduction histidine kinase
MPAAMTVAAASGRAASMSTTLTNTLTGTPLTRSRVNGRLRSARAPPTATARLQPATIRVSVTAASMSRWTIVSFARSDRGPSPTEAVDLPTAVEDAIDLIGPAAARQIRLDAALQDVQVPGDRVLVERLVSNLIDNVVQHNVNGGWVLASTRNDAGFAELVVANGGEHIPQRSDPGRSQTVADSGLAYPRRRPGSPGSRSAPRFQPFRSCRAMTMRWIWLVPS